MLFEVTCVGRLSWHQKLPPVAFLDKLFRMDYSASTATTVTTITIILRPRLLLRLLLPLLLPLLLL